MNSLGLATVVYALMLAIWAVAAAARNRERSVTFAAALFVLQVAAVGQAIADIAAIAGGNHHPEVATNIGYLITSLVVLPLTVAATRMDRQRWGSIALAVGCVLLVVVSLRLRQTLDAPHV